MNIKTHEIRFIPGIVFAQGGNFSIPNWTLKMDILQPITNKPCPAIVFIPGGGFLTAARSSWLHHRMKLSEAGYVVASIEYRVAPLTCFPEPLEDVKSAIRYLRANASHFNIDTDKIGVMGNSAGGYLASFVGLTNGNKKFERGENLDYLSSVRCVVDIFGLSDLTRIASDFSERDQKAHHSAGAAESLWVLGSPGFFNGKYGGLDLWPEDVEAANPIAYVDENSVPMLLMHGSADMLVQIVRLIYYFRLYGQKKLKPNDTLLKEPRMEEHTGCSKMF